MIFNGEKSMKKSKEIHETFLNCLHSKMASSHKQLFLILILTFRGLLSAADFPTENPEVAIEANRCCA